jgi:hypothetical protein
MTTLTKTLTGTALMGALMALSACQEGTPQFEPAYVCVDSDSPYADAPEGVPSRCGPQGESPSGLAE